MLKNVVFLFKEKAILKLIVDYGTLLIGVEGAGLQREERVKGRTCRRECAEEASGTPAVR